MYAEVGDGKGGGEKGELRVYMSNVVNYNWSGFHYKFSDCYLLQLHPFVSFFAVCGLQIPVPQTSQPNKQDLVSRCTCVFGACVHVVAYYVMLLNCHCAL